MRLCLSSNGVRGKAPASAQPDTLDWHGYYPLEIGNGWEKRFDGAFLNIERRERIETDTLVTDHRWFVLTGYEEGWELGQDIAGTTPSSCATTNRIAASWRPALPPAKGGTSRATFRG
jgi:hypothetical protein